MAPRLLLVDDAPELRTALAKDLASRGSFTVVGEAGDGRTAIKLALEHHPDLIVLGLDLPELAGRELLTGLRDAAPDALVVVYSGSHTHKSHTTQRVEAYGDKTKDVGYLVDLLDEIGDRIPRTATMRLGPQARGVSRARRFVVDRCLEWGRPSIADDASIVVSELVANALIHVQSSCELTLGLRGEVLRIDVADHGGGMPDLRDATADEEHGRGLMLVSILCTAWGTEPRDDGKSVWAELRAESSMRGLHRPPVVRGGGPAGSSRGELVDALGSFDDAMVASAPDLRRPLPAMWSN